MSQPWKPGDVLQTLLDSRHWTQTNLAEILGRPAQTVNEIIHGKKEITRQTAAQLAAAFGTTPEYWLDLQDTYLLWKLSQQSDHLRKLAGIRHRARAFPDW